MAVRPIIDYAQHLILLDQLMKDIHNHCLDRRFKEANSLAILAIAELRMLSATCILMEGQDSQ